MLWKFDCLTQCPDLGSCCREFKLCINGMPATCETASVENFCQVNEQLAKEGLPFKVRRFNAQTKELSFTCLKLGSDGLCTQYAERPDYCRNYQPKMDDLCCAKASSFERFVIRIAALANMLVLKYLPR